jgi:hypothetical protein
MAQVRSEKVDGDLFRQSLACRFSRLCGNHHLQLGEGIFQGVWRNRGQSVQGNGGRAVQPKEH